jgi:DMSO/TMAO reductase YedYZ molybdopterin-dependent catalytic subunit
MRPRKPPFISEKTITRRSVLEWLGKGTVLALGAPVLKACADLGAHAEDAGDAVRDGEGDAAEAASDAGPDVAVDGAADTAVDGAADGGVFPFEPGSGAADVFRGWGERTVDPQDPRSILDAWRLTVDGLVENPMTFTFEELIALARQDQVTDFHCVEGWSVYDVPWNGVHLSTIFGLVRPQAAATHVAFHTIDERYNESLPLDVALEPRTMMGYGVGGSTLPLAHGFPLRVVAPRLLGYKNAKYVQRIELTDRELLGYWVRAGYPYAGEVPAGRLRPGKY